MKYLVVVFVFLMSGPGLADETHLEARAFVEEAVESALTEVSISKSTADLILKKDAEGHPLSFIPDCPVCLGVQDAISKAELQELDTGLPEGFSADKASTRTSSVARWVRRAVQGKLATLPIDQRLKMAGKLKAASDQGQRELRRYQSRKVQAYKMMWSCLMCDAASRAGEDVE